MHLFKKFCHSAHKKSCCACHWFCNLFKKGRTYKKGRIILSHGFHKVGIGTCSHPLAVYLDVQEPCDGVTTCVGNLNWVASKLHPCAKEFTIFADIKTNCCTIDYIVEY